MYKEQAFKLILEHYNGTPKDQKLKLFKLFKLNERFTGKQYGYMHVHARGADWHWLTITDRGGGQSMVMFTDMNGKITDWHHYSIKGYEVILSGKERVEDDVRFSFKY